MQLFDALISGKPGSPGLRVWSDGGWIAETWEEVVRQAFAIASRLRELGVERGSRVPCVMTNTLGSVRGLLASWLAGGTLASLPVPARGMDLHEYGEQLAGICARLESPSVFASRAIADVMPPALSNFVEVRAWEELEGGDAIEPDLPDEDDVVFIQYSSGSTDAPKGCMLTARAIAEQLEVIFGLLEGWPGERHPCVSWLPLSHDMGMFGAMVMPWVGGFDLYLSSPERFLRSPRSFLHDLAEVRAHYAAVPNSGLDFSVRAVAKGRGLPGDLSKLRSIVVGGERIEWRTLQAAKEQLAGCGFKARMLQPAYGLAEATLAVTAVEASDEPSMVSVDSTLLADSQVEEVEPDSPRATPIVCCGRPLRGCRVETVGESSLAPIRVGSRSLASAYFGDPVATQERFRDGWLATNDLGFIRDGRLYVVGRLDDVITVAGRNVYATEIEAAIAAIEQIRAGCCTIIEDSDSSRSRLVLMVELRDGKADAADVARAAGRISMGKAGITISECIVLERGTMPKTPSGKVQRFRCRQLLSNGELNTVARVSLRGG